MANKIYKKICPKCKKEITSLFISQLEYNYKRHIESHDKEIKGDEIK